MTETQESQSQDLQESDENSDTESFTSESSIGTICGSTNKWVWEKATDYIGKPYLSSKNSLRTIDWSKTTKLLKTFDHKNRITDIVPLKHDEVTRSMLYSCSNILTKRECDEIFQNCSNERLQKMNIQYQSGRNNSRLVCFDRSLSDYIWEKLQPIFEFTFTECQLIPFGFDVLRGNWEPSGVNEAFRLNQYSCKDEDFFSVHRDAQYCPSGDNRSIFSIVIYLNDGFVGGETVFYFPKYTSASNKKGLCIEEEIANNEGLENGYQKISVQPKCGDCVMFSPNILHESLKVKDSGLPLSKYIIKTDIMMKRVNNVKLGYNVSPVEKNDYFECLQNFREAQRLEMKGEHNKACKCYEKSLSIRHLYPTKEMLSEYLENKECFEVSNNIASSQDSLLFSSQESIVMESSQESLSRISHPCIFPFCVTMEVWVQIMCYLEYSDVLNLLYIFPHLKPCLRLINESYLMPSVELQDGIFTKFTYKSFDFVKHNLEACCRVLALYSVYLLGHSSVNKSYTVKYDPETNKVTSVPLKHLFSAVFYEEPSYGSIFKVKQNNSSLKDETKDLFDSVDRNFMCLRYGKEYFGIDMFEEFRCDIDVNYDTEDDDCYEDEFVVTRYKRDKKGKVHINGSNFETLCSYDRTYHLYKSYRDFADSDFLESFESYFEKAMEDIELGSDSTKSKMITSMINPNRIGAALIRRLTTKVESHDEAYGCKCRIGDSVPSSLFSDACETSTFNHLIYDFDKQKLNVTKFDDGNNDETCCLMQDYLNVRVQFTCDSDIFGKFNVDVENVSKDASFNHASCQCAYPSFEVNEYVNLQSYPLLNHVHTLFIRNKKGFGNEEVTAWTSYGGIVCL